MILRDPDIKISLCHEKLKDNPYHCEQVLLYTEPELRKSHHIEACKFTGRSVVSCSESQKA